MSYISLKIDNKLYAINLKQIDNKIICWKITWLIF